MKPVIVAIFALHALYVPFALCPTVSGFAENRRAAAILGPLVSVEAPLYAPNWYCTRFSTFLHKPPPALKCMWGADTAEKKRAFLEGIGKGYVITGGPFLQWYGGETDWLNLEELGFIPPPHWTLMFRSELEPDGVISREPLRIWKVG